MSLRDDVVGEVAAIFRNVWSERAGRTVPDETSIGLGNDSVSIEATVLYADLADSTIMVDKYKPAFAAEVYKAFLHCAAKIIRANGGAITAYDGDRVMAVFIGDAKNTSAVRASMELHWAIAYIVQPALDAQYPNGNFKLKHVVGIDTSMLFVAKTGIRGSNDLVWVGRAANYAAKLSALPDLFQKYITHEVYERLDDSVKYSNGTPMWEAVYWGQFDNRIIYRSSWWYSF